MPEQIPDLDDATVAALQQMHHDPFTQGAIWRLFTQAPGLLNPETYLTLVQANRKD